MGLLPDERSGIAAILYADAALTLKENKQLIPQCLAAVVALATLLIDLNQMP